MRELIKSVENHFAYEEALFPTIGSTDVGHHAKEHGILRLRLSAIARDVDDLDAPPRCLADLIDALAAVIMTDHLTLDLDLQRWQSDGGLA